ncbi:hypothetical protein SM124_20165 [Bacillus sp. 31A1R]|uniref:Uncharacterized protein n=1 Tax=Robertmurraya mangrovi TaxID=3098077 RepID=A0ABU5J3T7_9BACI|nr:hypothetical protein [Bacillus sp. 31A1R]MDZ5474041.1 hypothetical protein [Bacillus sp. 31A1R]
MVTISFAILLTCLIGLIAIIDTFIYQSSFLYPLLTILRINPGTNKWMVYFGLGIGLISSLIVDYRLKKEKGLNKNN